MGHIFGFSRITQLVTKIVLSNLLYMQVTPTILEVKASLQR